MTKYTALLVNEQYKTWMVRRWTPPLTNEQLATYNSGGKLEPYPQYDEVLVSGFDNETLAIQGAIRQQSWA